MRHCPKCSLVFGDASRICRSCGAILEHRPDDLVVPEATEEVEAALSPFSDSSETDEPRELNGPEQGWACSNCKEFVPDSFDVCWNCNQLRPEGVAIGAAPESRKIEAGDIRPPVDQPVTQRCAACGSDKIIPNTTVVDQGQHSSGSLMAVVIGAPEALFFKDRLYGTLTADICGECGHVQIKVSNAAQLYKHYCKSL